MTIPENPKPGERYAEYLGCPGLWRVMDWSHSAISNSLTATATVTGIEEHLARLIVFGSASVAMLRELEWVGQHLGRRWCPSCHRPEQFSHSEDCRLVAVLKSLEGT